MEAVKPLDVIQEPSGSRTGNASRHWEQGAAVIRTVERNARRGAPAVVEESAPGSLHEAKCRHFVVQGFVKNRKPISKPPIPAAAHARAPSIIKTMPTVLEGRGSGVAESGAIDASDRRSSVPCLRSGGLGVTCFMPNRKVGALASTDPRLLLYNVYYVKSMIYQRAEDFRIPLHARTSLRTGSWCPTITWRFQKRRCPPPASRPQQDARAAWAMSWLRNPSPADPCPWRLPPRKA